ncbi:MAG: hypothetical protein NTW87_32645 [Planctomycetota bacterium]|nr:hypothetical protein [Planctomycetota bacterium]
MKAILIAPRKYVQGRNALREAGEYIGKLGKKPLVLWDSRVKAIVGERVLGLPKEPEPYRNTAFRELPH